MLAVALTYPGRANFPHFQGIKLVFRKTKSSRMLQLNFFFWLSSGDEDGSHCPVFHGTGTQWDQDTEGCDVEDVPVRLNSVVYMSRCVPFPWGQGTTGPGHRGLWCRGRPCVSQSLYVCPVVSHSLGARTQLDWDTEGCNVGDVPVCLSFRCVHVPLNSIPMGLGLGLGQRAGLRPQVYQSYCGPVPSSTRPTCNPNPNPHPNPNPKA